MPADSFLLIQQMPARISAAFTLGQFSISKSCRRCGEVCYGDVCYGSVLTYACRLLTHLRITHVVLCLTNARRATVP